VLERRSAPGRQLPWSLPRNLANSGSSSLRGDPTPGGELTIHRHAEQYSNDRDRTRAPASPIRNGHAKVLKVPLGAPSIKAPPGAVTRRPGPEKLRLLLARLQRMCWPVERTDSWLSNFGQLRRNTNRKTSHRLAEFALAIAVRLTAKLIDWKNSRSPASLPTR